MRGQYSLEALLVLAGFFVVMGIFVGIYVRFSEEETRLGGEARLRLDLGRIRNAVNDVYVLGHGNERVLEIGLFNCSLEAGNGRLALRAGKNEAEGGVFTEPKVYSCGPRLGVRNVAGTVEIRAE